MSTTWFYAHELCRLRRAWVDAVAEHARRPCPTARERAHAAFDAYFAMAEELRLEHQRPSDRIVAQRRGGRPDIRPDDGPTSMT